jgi:hypothetical protein
MIVVTDSNGLSAKLEAKSGQAITLWFRLNQIYNFQKKKKLSSQICLNSNTSSFIPACATHETIAKDCKLTDYKRLKEVKEPIVKTAYRQSYANIFLR